MSFSIIVYIIICVISVIVFLLHESEKGGMGIIGGYSNTILGTSRVSFIGKIATIFAVLFFISALFLSILSSGNKSVLKSIETETETTPIETEEIGTEATPNQIQEQTPDSESTSITN